jgi:hypothetical protein
VEATPTFFMDENVDREASGEAANLNVYFLEDRPEVPKSEYVQSTGSISL